MTPIPGGNVAQAGKGPTTKIWRDGVLVDWADATIHVLAHSVHYGSSVFEGVRCYEGPNGGQSSACATTCAASPIRRRSIASR